MSRKGLNPILVAGFLLLSWLSAIQVPREAIYPHLDPSFQAALSYLLEKGMQWGPEVNYTHGPMGHFIYPAYAGYGYYGKIIWHVLFNGFSCLIAFLIGRRIYSRSLECLFYLCFLVLSGMHSDGNWLFCLLAVTLIILKGDCRAPGILAGAGFMACMSLVKFTFLIHSLALLIPAVLLMVQRRELYKAGWLAISFPAWILVAWTLLKQHPANFAEYILNSLELMKGVSFGMGLEGVPFAVEICTAIGLLYLIQLLILPGFELRTFPGFLFRSLLAVSYFLAWKHGIYRADSGHITGFASYSILFLFLLPAFVSEPVLKKKWLFGGAGVILCFFLLFYVNAVPPNPVSSAFNNLTALMNLNDTKRLVEEDLVNKRAGYGLTTIKEVVGSSPADQFGHHQGIILLSEINYKPRPVFQSYVAQTSFSIKRNAEFYRRNDRPAFILFEVPKLDNQLPAAADSSALLEIFNSYHPMMGEKSILLMSTNSVVGKQVQKKLIKEQAIGFNEAIDLTTFKDEHVWMEMEIPLSLAGALSSFAYRSPGLQLQVQLQDGSERVYVLNPITAQVGFLIKPFLFTNTEFVKTYANQSIPPLRSCKVLIQSGGAVLFKGKISVRFFEIQNLVGQSISPFTAGKILYPMMKTPPVEVKSESDPEHLVTSDGVTLLLFRGASEMHFEVPPGECKATGIYGMVPQSYQGGQTDGVLCEALFKSSLGTTNLMTHFLDPLHRESDRFLQNLNVQWNARERGTLILKFSPGHRNDSLGDWAFWTNVEIQTF